MSITGSEHCAPFPPCFQPWINLVWPGKETTAVKGLGWGCILSSDMFSIRGDYIREIKSLKIESDGIYPQEFDTFPVESKGFAHNGNITFVL